MTWAIVLAAAGLLGAAMFFAGPRLFEWHLARRRAIPWARWVAEHGPLPCGCSGGRRADTGEYFAITGAEHRRSTDPLPPDLARYDKELSS